MLAELQRSFAADIRGGELDSLTDYLQWGSHDRSRFNIYSNNYQVSLSQALIATYPLVTKLIGKSYMQQVIRDFIEHHPPTDGDIALYGSGFALFLSHQAEMAPIAFVKDIANYEYKLDQLGTRVYREPTFCLEALREISSAVYPKLIFTLAQHIDWLESHYPINQLIDAIESDSLNAIPAREPEQVLLIKQADHTRLRRPLSRGEWRLLNHFHRQRPLSTLTPEISAELPTLLQRFILDGWIIGYRLQGDT